MFPERKGNLWPWRSAVVQPTLALQQCCLAAGFWCHFIFSSEIKPSLQHSSVNQPSLWLNVGCLQTCFDVGSFLCLLPGCVILLVPGWEQNKEDVEKWEQPNISTTKFQDFKHTYFVPIINLKYHIFLILQWLRYAVQYVWIKKCYFTVFVLLCCRALKLCGSGGPTHVKLVIEWDHKTKEWWVEGTNIFFSGLQLYKQTLHRLMQSLKKSCHFSHSVHTIKNILPLIQTYE